MNEIGFKTICLVEVLKPKGYIRGPFGSALKKDDMTLDGIPVYEQQHVINNHRNFRYFISKSRYDELKRFAVQPNDLIISCSGTIGKVAIISEKDPVGVINQALLILRCDTQKILPMYLKYYFSSDEGCQSLIERAEGSVQVNMAKRSVIENISFNLPTMPMQKRIVDILTSFDDKIKANDENMKILEDCIQTIYQNLFCNESAQVGWDKIILKDIVERITKKNNPSQTEITITISAKDGITSSYYTKRVASKDLSKYTVVEKGDFVYNRSSSDGYPVGVIRRLDEFERVALSPIYFCFRAKNNVSAKFLTYYFNSEDFTTSLYQIVGIGSRGHGMLNFSMNDFMGINLALPPMFLQQEFETIIVPIEKKIAKLKEENTVLAEIRDTLLPKLMSGELPVKVGGD